MIYDKETIEQQYIRFEEVCNDLEGKVTELNLEIFLHLIGLSKYTVEVTKKFIVVSIAKEELHEDYKRDLSYLAELLYPIILRGYELGKQKFDDIRLKTL